MSKNLEIRKVQASRVVVVPKAFSEKLQIERGDFLKFSVDGTRLIVEKFDGVFG